MRIEKAEEPIIDLGYEGESLATKIVFTAPDDWEVNNNISIFFDYPKFKEPLILNPTKIENKQIELDVTDEITLAGFGQMQFVMTKPGTDFVAIYKHLKQVDPDTLIIKSRIFDTMCRKSIDIIQEEQKGAKC